MSLLKSLIGLCINEKFARSLNFFNSTYFSFISTVFKPIDENTYVAEGEFYADKEVYFADYRFFKSGEVIFGDLRINDKK